LKKQSQCQNRQCGIKLVIVRSYRDFGDFERFWAAKNKPNSNPILRKGKRKNESSSGIVPVGDLKKQSQFAGVQIGVNYYVKGR